MYIFTLLKCKDWRILFFCIDIYHPCILSSSLSSAFLFLSALDDKVLKGRNEVLFLFVSPVASTMNKILQTLSKDSCMNEPPGQFAVYPPCYTCQYTLSVCVRVQFLVFLVSSFHKKTTFSCLRLCRDSITKC